MLKVCLQNKTVAFEFVTNKSVNGPVDMQCYKIISDHCNRNISLMYSCRKKKHIVNYVNTFSNRKYSLEDFESSIASG